MENRHKSNLQINLIKDRQRNSYTQYKFDVNLENGSVLSAEQFYNNDEQDNLSLAELMLRRNGLK